MFFEGTNREEERKTNKTKHMVTGAWRLKKEIDPFPTQSRKKRGTNYVLKYGKGVNFIM